MRENSYASGSSREKLSEGDLAAPPPKLAVLPKGSLDGPLWPRLTKSPMPEPETRLRQWAIQNGYKVKNVHTHHHADLDTFFVIFEAGKGS